MLFERFGAWAAIRGVGDRDRGSAVLLVATAREGWGDEYAHRVGVYREQLEIEQGV